MSLTTEQSEEIRRLAKTGKSGGLIDLASKWGVPFAAVARHYADCQRELNGATGPRPPKSPPLQELTDLQKQHIRRLAQAGNTAKLSTLAEEWNVDSRVISRYYNDCRDELIKQTQVNPEPAGQVPAPPTAADLVATVVATPGQIGVMPRNWPLIQARLNSPYSVREIALAAGMNSADYSRVEEGRQLPTPDQAAKICALLKLELDKTFVVASETPLFTKGAARGLSVLGILRARRRLAIKSLAAAVQEATGQAVSTALISQIERGALKQPLADLQARHIEAIAQYFQVTSEAITAQVPPEWIQSAAANIATMHSSLKERYQALQTPTMDPVLALTGTGGDDVLE